MTLGLPNSGCSVIGSERNTSSAAPATLPESMAAFRSSSTTSGPRATLRIRTPSFIFANASASSQSSVSGVLGRCSGDEVRGGVHGVRAVGPLDAELAKALLGHVGVERQHAHAEAAGALGHELADAPEAQHPERLLVQLDAAVARPFPGPRCE